MGRNFEKTFSQDFENVSEVVVNHNLGKQQLYFSLIVDGVKRMDVLSKVELDKNDPKNSFKLLFTETLEKVRVQIEETDQINTTQLTPESVATLDKIVGAKEFYYKSKNNFNYSNLNQNYDVRVRLFGDVEQGSNDAFRISGVEDEIVAPETGWYIINFSLSLLSYSRYTSLRAALNIERNGSNNILLQAYSSMIWARYNHNRVTIDNSGLVYLEQGDILSIVARRNARTGTVRLNSQESYFDISFLGD